MKKEVEKQFQENISFMKGLKKLIPFFTILIVAIWTLYLLYSPNDINFKSNNSRIIYYIIMFFIILITGWLWYKMDIWFMNKKIKIMEKAYEDVKMGRKPSRLKVIFSIIFLFLALPVLGSFLLWLGIRSNTPKIILLGAGLWVIILYAVFIGLKHYINNHK